MYGIVFPVMWYSQSIKTFECRLNKHWKNQGFKYNFEEAPVQNVSNHCQPDPEDSELNGEDLDMEV